MAIFSLSQDWSRTIVIVDLDDREEFDATIENITPVGNQDLVVRIEIQFEDLSRSNIGISGWSLD